MRRRLIALATVTAALAASAAVIAPPAQARGRVTITAAYYDPRLGPDPDTNAGRNAEYIVIRNSGARNIALTGWVLHDVPRAATTNSFVFPRFTLRAGHTVRIHTGSGSNTGSDLYWGKSVYVWGDDSDTATLLNGSGTVLGTCSWTTTDSSPKYC